MASARKIADDSQDDPKTFEEILEEEVQQGLRELERPAGGLLLSGLSAGLDIGFSLFFMAAALTVFEPVTSEPVTRAILANMYAVGFIFVVLGRSSLFTEHTALAVFPVLDGQAGLRQLARLWGLVYASNVVGAALFAVLSVLLGTRLGLIERAAFETISHELVRHDALTIVLSAVAAGWLMGMLSWLVSAGQDTLARLVVVWLITAGIGFAGLHHCIVGSVEVLAGLVSGMGTTLGDYGHFLLWSTVGNTIGGVAFVAILKYSHASMSSEGKRPRGHESEAG